MFDSPNWGGGWFTLPPSFTSLMAICKTLVHCSRGVFLSVYLYLICLFIFVCVKDRSCLTIAIRVYCFNINESIFSVLFSLLIKKLILGCETIWKRMRKFPSTVWNVSTFPHVDKAETSFSWRQHIGMVWIFQYSFIRSENLKAGLNI